MIVEESPIQIERQEGYLDENSGLYCPQVRDSIPQIKGEELETFVESSLYDQEDLYAIDDKSNLVTKLMQDGSNTMYADYASYVLHHMKVNEKNIDKENIQVVFGDMTPEEMSTSFIESFGNMSENTGRRE